MTNGGNGGRCDWYGVNEGIVLEELGRQVTSARDEQVNWYSKVGDGWIDVFTCCMVAGP